ncbi:23S rRNA (guanosine(2251)-2'-O)-methyltransferase RlmB [Algicola sagamiensis]|uniref:23S rRNA (guanosine(2251)-2'-O)-methyltransferase RlmB n=1 Tax=Algicola sagamiensis TaxID=163869 RepID=UPI00037FA6C4|nr:23S rRNA (guanosine(2251)-2'-O)-methyltransferase RlmB [Algicola sagamiensis]
MSQQDLVFGLHAVESILKHAPERLIELYALKNRDDEKLGTIINQGRRFGVSVQFMQRKALDDKARGEQHQGVVAKVKPLKPLTESDLEEILGQVDVPFLLVLDSVTDPHNLGACLRSADAAGVHAVIVPKDKSARITPVVEKVACGAAQTVPLIQVTNLARTLRWLKEQNIWVTGTAGETDQTVYTTKFNGPTAIVMGAEGTGLRRLTREICDDLVKIPMQGSVSSLNVSVAAGIVLFEVLRQRLS